MLALFNNSGCHLLSTYWRSGIIILLLSGFKDHVLLLPCLLTIWRLREMKGRSAEGPRDEQKVVSKVLLRTPSNSLRAHGLYIQSMEFSRPEYWSGSCSLLQGIFPTQGSKRGLPHCRWILYHLSYQGSLSDWVPFTSQEYETMRYISLKNRSKRILGDRVRGRLRPDDKYSTSVWDSDS